MNHWVLLWGLRVSLPAGNDRGEQISDWAEIIEFVKEIGLNGSDWSVTRVGLGLGLGVIDSYGS